MRGNRKPVITFAVVNEAKTQIDINGNSKSFEERLKDPLSSLRDQPIENYGVIGMKSVTSPTPSLCKKRVTSTLVSGR